MTSESQRRDDHEIRDSRRYAVRLVQRLSGGGAPAAIPTDILLADGEHCFAAVPGELWTAAESVIGWRPVDRGAVYLTDRRLALRMCGRWLDLPYAMLRACSTDDRFVSVDLADRAPIALRMCFAGYWFVLLQHLASTQGHDLPLPASSH